MKNLLRSRLLAMLSTSILLASVIVIQSTLAANLREKVSVTPGRTISPAEENILSRAAARTLRHIAEARTAIHVGNIDQAKENLQQARTLINIIKSQRPTAKVHDHIWVAKQHLDYESTEDVAADLIPIDADLTEIEDEVPIEQARKHVQRARGHLKNGNKQAAKKELEAADAALIYTEVDLPLAATEQQVIKAENMLAKNKTADADKALRSAEDGVQHLSEAIFSPVTQARRSIWQATRDYAAKNYAAAKMDLGKASEWLSEAAQSTDKVTRKEAAKLKRDLEAMKKKVSRGDEKTKSALTSLWARSQALAERESENVSTGWAKLRGKSTAKTALIEAKLHLAYAENAQLIQGKTAEAARELDQAQGYLDQAIKTSDKTLAMKIHAMSGALKGLKAALDDKGIKAHARYEKLKSDLRQTIRVL